MSQENYLKIIEPIIKKAGKSAFKKWQKFDRQNVMLKGKKDLVTQIDLDTEKYLIKEIKKVYPNHSFLAEESGEKTNNSPFTWIIDPIDGTTNFSIKNPLWSISIALAKENEIIFGAIYIPFSDELFHAYKNKGAYLNKKKIKLNKNINANKLIHTYCHGSDKKSRDKAIKYYTLQKQSSVDCRQLGSAAIELCYVASSRVDSIVIPGAKAWDIAAGALIAKEAHANVLDFKGKAWTLNSSDILVCHPKAKNQILSILKKIK